MRSFFKVGFQGVMFFNLMLFPIIYPRLLFQHILLHYGTSNRQVVHASPLLVYATS
jgi:hypothetical protein